MTDTTRIRAVRYYGTEDLRVEDIPRPAVTDKTVKVAPAYVGLCGSDLFEYLYGPKQIPVNADPGTKDKIPITIGHEFAGKVVQVGKEVTDLKVGDKVAIEPTHKCGKCAYCKEGTGNLCVNFGSVGMNGGGGGLQKEVVLLPKYLHKLPEHVSLRVGALVEPLAVANHAISRVGSIPKSALILGAGPIGLALLLVLRAKGITNILVSEPSETRNKMAKDFGATRVINPITDDVKAACIELANNHGIGVDCAFDAAGVGGAGVEAAVSGLRSGGTLINIAQWKRPLETGGLMAQLTNREITYRGSMCYESADFKEIIRLLGEGKLKTKGMVTGIYDLEKTKEEGYNQLINHTAKHVKVLIKVQHIEDKEAEEAEL